METPTTTILTVDDTFAALRVWAEMFEDAQKARIACGNRIARGNVDPAVYAPQMELLLKTEHEIALGMRRALRTASPVIAEWVKDTRGVGEHLVARLLGAIGHPRIAQPHHWESGPEGRVLMADEPFERNVAKLWAYCGVGDPARKRKRGMSAEDALKLGQPRAKMLVRQLAEAQVKSNGDYRPVYDSARMRYKNRAHVAECPQCGPAGKPAQPGSEWSLAHQHAAALRKVGKELLKDLWVISKPPQVVE